MDSASRVLLVYHNPLFAHSLRVALQAAPGIRLIGELDDWTRVQAEIAQLSPDVVLIEEDEQAATDALLEALSPRQAPWRVVALRLDETTMHIWTGAGQALKTPQDLYGALRPVSRRTRKNSRAVHRMTPAHGGQ